MFFILHKNFMGLARSDAFVTSVKEGAKDKVRPAKRFVSAAALAAAGIAVLTGI
jgi:hypothetical protein